MCPGLSGRESDGDSRFTGHCHVKDAMLEVMGHVGNIPIEVGRWETSWMGGALGLCVLSWVIKWLL